jgi:hypothetical protein
MFQFDQAFSLSIPPVPPATPLSITSTDVGDVILSGVCVPVLISDPAY